jgi:hypothetical protein
MTRTLYFVAHVAALLGGIYGGYQVFDLLTK